MTANGYRVFVAGGRGSGAENVLKLGCTTVNILQITELTFSVGELYCMCITSQ